ncbi:acid-sensing ion channel 5-like [Clytia hemisphaerica]|uniref:acid-sensing ion channel 5-like n=1 Tax=Clytia hemisphaerica TaxID=252671 RepID=UPI0034D52231
MKTEADISIHHKPLKTHKELVEEFYSGITLHGFRFLFEGNKEKDHNSNNTGRFIQDLIQKGIDTKTKFINSYDLPFEEIFQSDVLEHLAPGGSCNFYGQKCDTSWFTARYIQEDSCYQFNGLESSLSQSLKAPKRSGGYFNGFDLVLDFGKAMIENLSFSNVVITMFESFGTRDDHIPINGVIQLSTGTTLFAKITEKENKMLPSPYNTHCGTKTFNFLDPILKYSKGLCIIDCIIGHIYKNMACVGEEFRSLINDGYEFCLLKDLPTYYQVLNELYEGDVFENTCYHTCPNECVRKSYTVRKSTYRIGSQSVYEEMKKTIPKFNNRSINEIEKYISDNILKIHVAFFDSTIETEEMQPAVSWNSLIATMGGAIGLGLGFSFITGFEFLFFFLTSLNCMATT